MKKDDIEQNKGEGTSPRENQETELQEVNQFDGSANQPPQNSTSIENAQNLHSPSPPQKPDMKKFLKRALLVLFIALFISLIWHDSMAVDEINKTFKIYGSYRVDSDINTVAEYVVIDGTDSYYIYEQFKMLDKGTFEKKEIEKNLSVLTLTSSAGKSSSQIVCHRDKVVLAGFKEEVIVLQKFSEEGFFVNISPESEVDVDQRGNSSDEG